MKPNFSKGLLPAIVQDTRTRQVLMLGYMDEAAFLQTQTEGKVTFFSRSKNRLWTKGETSGNFLLVESIQLDCDADSLLILAQPQGPTCHTGAYACFGEKEKQGFLYELESIIDQRLAGGDENSYTLQLFNKGINKVAQKVGEEAVELVIEAKDNNVELFKNEAADLLFHLLILLKAKGCSFNDIEQVLLSRHQERP